MERQRRRSQAEQKLPEGIQLQQPPLQQPQEQPQAPGSDDTPKLKQGQHLQPLPDGGHMIITNGFNA